MKSAPRVADEHDYDVVVIGSGAAGLDEDFGRGATFWDRHRMSDPNNEPSPTFGTIEVPPFYAYPFKASFLGTKGGPRTNEQGQVVDQQGKVIRGLYAAGNVMANSFGSKAVGAGTTLGPCLTWGYICGLQAHRGLDRGVPQTSVPASARRAGGRVPLRLGCALSLRRRMGARC